MSTAEPLRLLVTVTLNPNQLRAHLEPITDLDEIGSVTLVADVAGPAMDKLTTVVPPAWLMRAAGRAAAKLMTGLAVALRRRPDWVLGYNLVPHGINALVIGRLTGARVLMHLIGGPVEWEGGGFRSDNALLRRLPRPVPLLERALVWVAAAADVAAVMGSGARRDLLRRGLDARRVAVVPASVDVRRFPPARGPVRYDMVTASQLIERKRLEDFLLAVAALRERRPEIRAAIAGRGPLLGALQAEARRLGVAGAVDFLGFVDDIASVYRQSRVFVLTSRAEGLSIAMSEAMASGLPAVVTDVGEARDLVVPGRTGFLFDVGDAAGLVGHVARLLDDDDLRAAMSSAAAEAVRTRSGRDRVAAINRTIFAPGQA